MNGMISARIHNHVNKMSRNVLLIAFLLLTVCVYGQDASADKYAATITPADLKGNLSIIASDAMEGRETGKRGQKMAAAFISFSFQEMGLTPPFSGSYYQDIPLYSVGSAEVTLKSADGGIESNEYRFVGTTDTNGLIKLPIVFVGTGSDAELKKIAVSDKAVALVATYDVPTANNAAVVSLKQSGAKMVFVILESETDFTRIVNRQAAGSDRSLSLTKPAINNTNSGIFYITGHAAARIFNTQWEALKKLTKDKRADRAKPSQVSYSISPGFREVKSENVLGFLEGTDKKDEVVVITAHYDHIGISSRPEGDKINNGADDDGSGTVAVLALAKAFAQAKKEGKGPRRSILFMTVTGEEKGLLGSQYYTNNPVYPLENTIVNLNIDMIGRRDQQHKNSPPYVYVIGDDKLSSELHNLSERTNNANHKLVFDYTYNDESHPDRLYYRSDHWNFAKKNIPIIFYFDGIHEDYHKVSDEIDKIEFDLLTLRTQTIFYTAWEIANRESRPQLDGK